MEAQNGSIAAAVRIKYGIYLKYLLLLFEFKPDYSLIEIDAPWARVRRNYFSYYTPAALNAAPTIAFASVKISSR